MAAIRALEQTWGVPVVPAALTRRIRLTLAGQTSGAPQWSVDLDKGSDNGYFRPDSATWAVHGGMSTIVAGTRALLLQALHPGAMAGVHDWSRYREDPLGRLNGTIRWIFTVTYGDTAIAKSSSDWVLKLHERVVGTYLDAAESTRSYSANDPELLSWVHLAFTDSFLATAKLWGAPIPGGPDAYVREWAQAGELMGVPKPPRSEAELISDLRAFYDAGILVNNDRVKEAVGFIRKPPIAHSLRPGYAVLFAGAVASLEQPYRGLLGLEPATLLGIPLPTIGATGLVLKTIGSTLDRIPPAEAAARRRLFRLGEAGGVDSERPTQPTRLIGSD